jgi:hypothetical protein
MADNYALGQSAGPDSFPSDNTAGSPPGHEPVNARRPADQFMYG